MRRTARRTRCRRGPGRRARAQVGRAARNAPTGHRRRSAPRSGRSAAVAASSRGRPRCGRRRHGPSTACTATGSTTRRGSPRRPWPRRRRRGCGSGQRSRVMPPSCAGSPFAVLYRSAIQIVAHGERAAGEDTDQLPRCAVGERADVLGEMRLVGVPGRRRELGDPERRRTHRALGEALQPDHAARNAGPYPTARSKRRRSWRADSPARSASASTDVPGSTARRAPSRSSHRRRPPPPRSHEIVERSESPLTVRSLLEPPPAAGRGRPPSRSASGTRRSTSSLAATPSTLLAAPARKRTPAISTPAGRSNDHPAVSGPHTMTPRPAVHTTSTHPSGSRSW